MSEPSSFAGTYSFGTLKRFLDTGMEHREILIKMQERFAGTPAVVGIPSVGELRAMHTEKRTVITASSSYLVAAYNSIGVEFGARGIFPWELEQVIAGGKWQRDKCYVDTGLVLDFSGREHALALDLYEQMPRERTLEGLPAVVANVSLEKTGVRKGFPQGLRFVVHEAMELRHAPAILGVSGYFDVRDAGLVKTGVPEKIVAEQLEGVAYRYLWNCLQKEKKLENVGISRLYLYGDIGVGLGNVGLAFSYDFGRGVPVFDARGASREHLYLRAGEKRTPLTDIELAPDGNFFHEGKVWAMFENSISWMKSKEEKERARMAFREGMRKEN